jgi:hypothetical protein
MMSNQNKLPRFSVDRETLMWTLSRIDGYISLMDTKCEVLLAAIAIGVGAACSNEYCASRVSEALGLKSGLLAFLLALCCVAACIAALFCMGAVLFPRTDSSKPHPSKLFFGDVAGMKPKPTVKAYLAEYDDQRTVEEDFAGEIIACSKICSKKALWHKRALAASMVTLVAFAVLMLLSLAA